MFTAGMSPLRAGIASKLVRTIFRALLSIGSVGQAAAADTWVWSLRGTNGAPPARVEATGVWTGREMLIWGGREVNATTTLKTGWAYDPQKDTWRAMSSVNAPSPRSLHTAVWTGKELLIWGGADEIGGAGPSPLRTGARYNPSTDKWSPISTAGPAARLQHSAVWTGKEMLVWGGNDYEIYFANGGRYDPLSDSWKAISNTGAPHGRSSINAIWTGVEMVVWGGNFLTCSGYDCQLNYPTSLGRYNPVSDTWWTTVVPGAPTLRADFSAVWDGARMIVWGGYTGSTYGERTRLRSGGCFDPMSGEWSATSVTQAPAARDQHIAVWTGEEMLIWGGTANNRSGGRYDPVSNSWLAIATNGSPANAFSGEGVWTGEALLVYHGKLYAYYQPGVYAWDGLPDAWQRAYFGSANPTGAAFADADGDGQNNTLEYLAGTDPTDSRSRFEFSVRRPESAETLELNFSPWIPGRTYSLLYSTNLQSAHFTAASASLKLESGAGVFTLPRPVQSSFYRLELSVP